jgi:hypothetical protein
LLETGATPGGSFASGFQSARQVWDVAAALQPALGRSASGLSGDDLFSSDRAAEVGVLRLVLQGGGDSAFTAGLADVLAHPVVNGPAAALRFDGALLGLDAGTTLSVYMVGNPFTGEAVLDLPNASHHALWRTNFDRLTLIDGPAAGLLVGGTLEAAGSQLTADGGEVYLGEGFGGLLTLSGGTGRIALNNAYGDQLMVVASWGEVSAPVPEPGAALLLAGGLAVVALVRRRRR